MSKKFKDGCRRVCSHSILFLFTIFLHVNKDITNQCRRSAKDRAQNKSFFIPVPCFLPYYIWHKLKNFLLSHSSETAKKINHAFYSNAVRIYNHNPLLRRKKKYKKYEKTKLKMTLFCTILLQFYTMTEPELKTYITIIKSIVKMGQRKCITLKKSNVRTKMYLHAT